MPYAGDQAVALDAATTICIVDDDAAVRSAVSLLVRSCGWDPMACADGAELLSVIADQWPACVILDLQMPGMDGLSVQKELARQGVSIPVIVTTTFIEHPMVEQARRNGARQVISKPFRPDELIEAISSAVKALD